MSRRDRFPGFETCLRMIRNRHPDVSEEGFGWLAPRAAQFVPQLIAAFWDEDNANIRFWLIELIAMARSPEALPFLVERLHDEDAYVRDQAIWGLRQLNTRESRTALWQAGIASHPHA